MWKRSALRLFLSITLLLGLTLRAAPAQPARAAMSIGPAALPPGLVSADGSLNPAAGFNGTLDLRGWRVTLDADRGPLFQVRDAVQSRSGQANGGWLDFDAGPMNTVSAMAVSGSDVYVGGMFTSAGGVTANSIAKWDGTAWSALGTGTNNNVYAIAVSGSNVYVGGYFTNAGGAPNTSHIAKWDGSAWSALGTGTNDQVNALAIYGSQVYVGGWFTSAGDAPNTGHIAQWDGSAWSAMGAGANGPIWAIALRGNTVYVGGGFTSLGSVEAHNVAVWDGNHWSDLGVGVDGPGSTGAVFALAFGINHLYVGGSFTTAGSVAAKNVAVWDGMFWSAMGSGVDGPVNALVVSPSNVVDLVYAGGGFSSAGDLAANNVAVWDGSAWSALGPGVDGAVNALAASGSDVYVGGAFTSASGVPNIGRYFAKWTTVGSPQWSALGAGTNSNVNALAASGSRLYAGGIFTTASGVPDTDYIAQWDGNGWSALSPGVDGPVNALAVSGQDVYAGGSFTSAGGVPNTSYIARWDGSAWRALGGGTDGLVKSIVVYGGDVYAGGAFTHAGSVAANHIAKWNGSAWSALSSGVDGLVTAIAVSGSDVYAGGVFTIAGSVAANNIAKWDGRNWSALGTGISGDNIVLPYIPAIAVNGSDVYVGGSFWNAGGIPDTTSIAKWDGTAWSALGTGTNNDVSTLAVVGNHVYVGGGFTSAGGVPGTAYIAKWDSGAGAWSALDAGPNYLVNTIAMVNSSEMYGGGAFTYAGGVANTSHIAKWVDAVQVAADPAISSTLTYTDTRSNLTSLFIPAAAVTQTTTLRYVPMKPTGTLPHFAFAGHGFTLEAYLGAAVLPGFVFSQPITLTLHYAEADVTVMDKASLALDYWTGSAWAEAACGAYDRHPAENWLAVPICHLSQFALMGYVPYQLQLPLVRR